VLVMALADIQDHNGFRKVMRLHHWLYNGAGSSLLITGLFHSMHNAIVNSTGLVAVVALPQFEVLVIMAGIVVLAAAIITVATRGRLGLNRSPGPSATK
jgi:Ni,Fe-hydrogenase I cytochrome b subunit